MANTVKLFGDGRHPVGLSFGWDGRTLRVRFVGPDRAVEVDGERDIPVRLAEALRDHPGTGIFFGGGEPVDAGVYEKKKAERKETDAERVRRGEQEPEMVGRRKWPTMELSKAELVKLGIAEGLKREEINLLHKADVLAAVIDVYTEKFPQWAEENS